MDADAFRHIALGMARAVEGAHMGHPDFRFQNKIFATLSEDLASGTVKLTPEQQQRFLEERGGGFVPAAGAWGRSGWTRVLFAAVEEDAAGHAITLAWQNMAQRAASGPRRRPAARATGRPAGRRSRSR